MKVTTLDVRRKKTAKESTGIESSLDPTQSGYSSPDSPKSTIKLDPFKALWEETVAKISVTFSKCPLLWIRRNRPKEYRKAQVIEREIEKHWHARNFEAFEKACKKLEMYMWTLYGRYSEIAEVEHEDDPDCSYLVDAKRIFGCEQCDGFVRGAWCTYSDRNDYVSIEILKECPLKQN